MFICNDCGRVFDEPGIHNERHPYGEGYATESFACCPFCGESFEEAEKCEVCGEYFPKYDLTDGMCDDCYEEEYGEDE